MRHFVRYQNNEGGRHFLATQNETQKKGGEKSFEIMTSIQEEKKKELGKDVVVVYLLDLVLISDALFSLLRQACV